MQSSQTTVLKEKVAPKKQFLEDIIKAVPEVAEGIRNTDQLIKQSLILTPKHPMQKVVDYVTGEGKNLRVLMPLLLSIGYTRNSNHNTEAVAGLTQIVHEFSKVMDDRIDNASKRHNKDTVHVKFGTWASETLNGIQDGAMERIKSTIDDVYKTTFSDVWGDFLVEISEGEAEDVLMECGGRDDELWKEHSYFRATSDIATLPTFKQYFSMIDKKTGSMLRASFGLAVELSGGTLEDIDNATTFGHYFGRIHQITDDYLDIYSEESEKKLGGDILSHKLGNYVLLTLLRSDEVETKDKDDLLSFIKQGNENMLGEALKICNDYKHVVDKDYKQMMTGLENKTNMIINTMKDERIKSILPKFIHEYIYRKV